MLLDTDVLIDIERAFPAADAWLASLPTVPAVAGFAAMELLNGCQNNADRRRVERFLRPFPVLWPTAVSLNYALQHFTPLRLAHGVGMLDALIAVTALEQGRPLVTFNVRHFAHIPGLVTVQPYTR